MGQTPTHSARPRSSANSTLAPSPTSPNVRLFPPLQPPQHRIPASVRALGRAGPSSLRMAGSLAPPLSLHPKCLAWGLLSGRGVRGLRLGPASPLPDHHMPLPGAEGGGEGGSLPPVQCAGGGILPSPSPPSRSGTHHQPVPLCIPVTWVLSLHFQQQQQTWRSKCYQI